MSENKKPHPGIGMCPCASSQVKAHGYDAATRTLAVEYKSGGTYHYHDVPAATYDSMKAAESVGKFIGANLKVPTQKFTKVPQE